LNDAGYNEASSETLNDADAFFSKLTNRKATRAARNGLGRQQREPTVTAANIKVE